MRKVFKYELSINPEGIEIQMPHPHKFVHFEYISKLSNFYVWAEVDPIRHLEYHTFRIFGTGWEIPTGWNHLFTIAVDNYIWHLYKQN